MARHDELDGVTMRSPETSHLPDAHPELEPVNILLVDDRPSNLSALQALLTQPDYNLILARSGPEALAQVLRHDIAVIVLDVAMPGMDGIEVASLIKQREQSRHIPIIFVTASVYEMEHVFDRYSVGNVDFIRKPLDANVVRGKVEVFVQLQRQRAQIERLTIQLREAEARAQRALRMLNEKRGFPEVDRR